MCCCRRPVVVVVRRRGRQDADGAQHVGCGRAPRLGRDGAGLDWLLRDADDGPRPAARRIVRAARDLYARRTARTSVRRRAAESGDEIRGVGVRAGGSWLLSLLVFFPLVGAALVIAAPRGRHALVRAIALATSLVPLACALYVVAHFDRAFSRADRQRRLPVHRARRLDPLAQRRVLRRRRRHLDLDGAS